MIRYEQLKNYQRDIVNQLLPHTRAAAFVKTGRGKTAIALNIMYMARAKTVIVICRANKKAEWANDLNEYGVEYTLITHGYFVNKDLPTVDMIIVDESQNIKSHKSNTYMHLNAYLAIRSRTRLLLLSGTPQHNMFSDYYTSLYLLKLVTTSYNKFIEQYAEVQTRDRNGNRLPYTSIVEYKNTDTLKALLQSGNIAWYFPTAEEDSMNENIIKQPISCWDVRLPRPKTLTQMLRDKLLWPITGQVIELDTAAKTYMYTRMAEAGSIWRDGLLCKHFGDDKIEYIYKYIMPKYDSVLICCNYTGEIKLVSEYLTRQNVPHNIYAGWRKDVITEKVVIINTNSGGSGVNDYKNFECLVFHSMPVKYIDYEQAIGRPDRIDTTRDKPLQVFNLIMTGEAKTLREHYNKLAFDYELLE